MNSCVSPLIDNENYPVIMPKTSNRKCLTMFFYCTSNLQLAPDIDNLCHTIFISLLYSVHGKVALSNLALGSFRIHRE